MLSPLLLPTSESEGEISSNPGTMPFVATTAQEILAQPSPTPDTISTTKTTTVPLLPSQPSTTASVPSTSTTSFPAYDIAQKK
jgi:hypothetical protein